MQKISGVYKIEKKMSEAKKGKNNPYWGKTHSKETRRKIGESRIGESHVMSKLTKEQVWDIHEKYATGNYTQKEIAKPLPISSLQVSFILSGDRWSHVYKKFKQYKNAR